MVSRTELLDLYDKCNKYDEKWIDVWEILRLPYPPLRLYIRLGNTSKGSYKVTILHPKRRVGVPSPASQISLTSSTHTASSTTTMEPKPITTSGNSGSPTTKKYYSTICLRSNEQNQTLISPKFSRAEGFLVRFYSVKEERQVILDTFYCYNC